MSQALHREETWRIRNVSEETRDKHSESVSISTLLIMTYYMYVQTWLTGTILFPSYSRPKQFDYYKILLIDCCPPLTYAPPFPAFLVAWSASFFACVSYSAPRTASSLHEAFMDIFASAVTPLRHWSPSTAQSQLRINTNQWGVQWTGIELVLHGCVVGGLELLTLFGGRRLLHLVLNGIVVRNDNYMTVNLNQDISPTSFPSIIYLTHTVGGRYATSLCPRQTRIAVSGSRCRFDTHSRCTERYHIDRQRLVPYYCEAPSYNAGTRDRTERYDTIP